MSPTNCFNIFSFELLNQAVRLQKPLKYCILMPLIFRYLTFKNTSFCSIVSSKYVYLYRDGKRWPQQPCRECQFIHSCANFGFFHMFFKRFLAFVVQSWAFLHDFGHFLNVFGVLIFQTQSFACAIL